MSIKAKRRNLVISCEHGGNRIPPNYKAYFAGQDVLLNSHRGYDPGALTMARELAKAFEAPLICSTTSRLLIDLNRSIGHPSLYSPLLSKASPQERQKILEHYYWPYRARVEDEIAERVALEIMPIVHISSHSFTPELDGKVRNADVSFLYDPSRFREKNLCARWLASLTSLEPSLRVRRNYPYTGKSDGLTAHLRQLFPPKHYVGIELEINQKFALEDGKEWKRLREVVVESLSKALKAPSSARIR